MNYFGSTRRLDYWDEKNGVFWQAKTHKWPGAYKNIKQATNFVSNHAEKIILGEPIEITEHEAFSVTIKIPDFILKAPMDGIKTQSLQEQSNFCQCAMDLLLRNGCECGGL